jgi:hypothetical protein
MKKSRWCEHLDKSSKFTTVRYEVEERQVTLKVQSWLCPHCGVHGAESEIVDTRCSEQKC